MMIDEPYTRPLEDVEAAIRTVMATRATKVNHRDRRERDMLSALRDVETYTVQIREEDGRIEKLFEERDRAIMAELAEKVVTG